jgi:light-regulated signal transduction histidine kinase (bacteriophytochrome)
MPEPPPPSDKGPDSEETERLRAENRALAAEVQALTSRLAEAQREMDALGYAISHDLRAPLRAVEGFSQILEEDHRDDLDEEARGHLARIRGGAQRLATMIEDLLQLSRLSRAPVGDVPVDLAAAAEEILAAQARRAPARAVAVSVMRPLLARGDAALLRVMLENLIANAWKFTAKQAAPVISVGAETRDGQSVFFVRDNGVGFDMTHAHRLFAPFQRLHGPAEFEGAGVGLAKVARIVARHGGRVWADAASDQGATFFFTLPTP